MGVTITTEASWAVPCGACGRFFHFTAYGVGRALAADPDAAFQCACTAMVPLCGAAPDAAHYRATPFPKVGLAGAWPVPPAAIGTGPFTCVYCTGRNDGGATCAHCGNERAEWAS